MEHHLENGMKIEPVGSLGEPENREVFELRQTTSIYASIPDLMKDKVVLYCDGVVSFYETLDDAKEIARQLEKRSQILLPSKRKQPKYIPPPPPDMPSTEHDKPYPTKEEFLRGIQAL